jgi:hypothetical protein
VNNVAERAVLSEWALKTLSFLTTSKLLVAGSIPAGVANIFNELVFEPEAIPTNCSNKAVGRFQTQQFFSEKLKSSSGSCPFAVRFRRAQVESLSALTV